MASHGQCVVITPFTLMGAMAPITLAGALAQQTAEAMAIIVLCQLLRPGTPCVMGGFTSNVDMRTGSPAFGTPEYVHATLATAQLGRRLRLPVRTSAVNASPAVDAQSTYETAFSLQAAILSHSHLINHAAGWLEGGLVASLEKIVVDAEMLRGWAEILKPVTFDEDDLGVEAIKGVEPGGHFFGTAHTLARYESAFYRPLLSDWSNYENWAEAGARDATQRAAGQRCCLAQESHRSLRTFEAGGFRARAGSHRNAESPAATPRARSHGTPTDTRRLAGVQRRPVGDGLWQVAGSPARPARVW